MKSEVRNSCNHAGNVLLCLKKTQIKFSHRIFFLFIECTNFPKLRAACRTGQPKCVVRDSLNVSYGTSLNDKFVVVK